MLKLANPSSIQELNPSTVVIVKTLNQIVFRSSTLNDKHYRPRIVKPRDKLESASASPLSWLLDMWRHKEEQSIADCGAEGSRGDFRYF